MLGSPMPVGTLTMLGAVPQGGPGWPQMASDGLRWPRMASDGLGWPRMASDDLW